MNKEKIISNIEKYVNTLTAKEIKLYNSVISDNSNIRELKEIYPITELAEIVRELKREIKEQALKESKGNNFVKRSKLITKLLEKNYDPRTKEAFFEEINGEQLQCCNMLYYAFAFRDILEIPMVKNNETTMTLKRVIPSYKDFPKTDYDIAEIKTALKLHKAKKDKTPCLIKINEKTYNAEYFIHIIDGLGGEVEMYQNPQKISIDVFESENGIAVLCPVRPKE